MQARIMPSVNVRSARDATRLAAGRSVLRGNKRGDTLSPSEETGKGGRPEGKIKMEKKMKHGTGRYKVIETRRLRAVSQNLP